MKVLIVEDDTVLSLLISRMIERLGYTVTGVVSKGREAVTKIKQLKPDLILMDIMLEDDLDGINAIYEVREESINTPVIFITGNSDPYNKDRAKETKYIDYLIKPITFNELTLSIEKIPFFDKL
ncbi:MAG: response regulator [Balneolaceae bacterium]